MTVSLTSSGVGGACLFHLLPRALEEHDCGWGLCGSFSSTLSFPSISTTWRLRFTWVARSLRWMSTDYLCFVNVKTLWNGIL